MVIRELQEGDFDRGFLESLAALTTVDLNIEEARAIFRRRLPNQFTFVAIDGDRIIGTVSLFVDQKYIRRGGRVGHIEDVSVVPDMQRRGIGTQLVQFAVDRATQENCYKVILHCFADVSRFYQRLGFRDYNIGMRLDLPSSEERRQ